MFPQFSASRLPPLLKLTFVSLTLASIVVRAQVPMLLAIPLAVVFLGIATILFAGAIALTGVVVDARGLDRWCLAVCALPATFPFVIALAVLLGGWPAALVVSALLVAATRWSRGARTEGAAGETVPWPVYALAAAFTLWSVVNPFAHFNGTSLVREMYTDGFQRIGVIYALADRVPPANPFVDGLPLRYYWFAIAPMAALAKVVALDAFSVWKTVMTIEAFSFVVGLWWVARSLLRSAVGAWSVCLFAVVLASPEILAHPRLLDAWHDLAGGSVRAAIATLATIDPDHIVGVIVPHSDQLLMEDFLYIPQNVAAMLLFLAAAWLIAERHLLAAAVVVAWWTGTNTFYLLPGGAAFALVTWSLAGARRTAIALTWLAAFVAMAAWICRVIPGPSSDSGVRFAVVAAAVVATGAFWLWRQTASTPLRAVNPTASAKWSGAALLAAVLAFTALWPSQVARGLLLNYPPAILLACGWRGWRGHEENRHRLAPMWMFVLVFGAAFFLLVAALVLPFWFALPAPWVDWANALGDAVNPFNFTHKVAKSVRLMWCLMAGAAMVPLWSWMRGSAGRTALCVLGALVIVPIASATTLIRPLTYLRNAPVREAPAAALLRGDGASIHTVVLLEDYRESQIHELLPISTYYISSWTAGARGLSNAVGTWASQYVPPNVAADTLARERRNASIFQSNDVGAAVLTLATETRLDYVLTRRPYPLGPGFRLLVDWPGGYLYRVERSR